MVWIATRKLTLGGDQAGNVEVNIGIPEEESPDTWRCPFRVATVDSIETEYAYGIDAFQALLIAVAGIKARLATIDGPVSWLGAAPGDEGDHGFPSFVPQAFGLAFSKHIEQVIEQEVAKLSDSNR